MIDRYPSLIVQCAGASDVVRALHFAREQNLEIAVRGGGHSISGYAVVDNGIVIDLSLMKDLIINPQQRTAEASPGLRLGEFIQATQAHGLLTTVGTDPDTGLAGLTLGGGMGSLMGKFGLACDNVLSFEMVTAEGEVVHASPGEDPDLYWGLRGGGGNFGVVTKFEFRLHPAAQVLGGIIAHPLHRAGEVLRFFRDFAWQMPDELTVFCALNNIPDRHPIVGFLVCYCGDLQVGERVIKPLRKFGSPVVDTVRPMLYSDLLNLGHLPSQFRYYAKGCTIPEITDEVIDIFVNAAFTRTSPFSSILIQHIHGAAARIAPNATAFAARGTNYMPFLMSQWEKGPDKPHLEWARNSWSALHPFTVGTMNVNFLGNESQNRVPSAYGGNYSRLVSLKRRFDPQNIFRINSNIRPD